MNANCANGGMEERSLESCYQKRGKEPDREQTYRGLTSERLLGSQINSIRGHEVGKQSSARPPGRKKGPEIEWEKGTEVLRERETGRDQELITGRAPEVPVDVLHV